MTKFLFTFCILARLGFLFSNDLGYNIALDFVACDYERPLVVCIPAYNNKQYIRGCLDSVFSQNYSNYKVIYIDDASRDGSYTIVMNYIEKHDLHDKISVLHNEKNLSMLANHYLMGHLCEDHEIVVSLDGDDKFATSDALARINRAYMDSDVWVTYGQFVESEGICNTKPRAILKHKFHPSIIRRMPFIFKQPRTYYAGLFKRIPEEYFMYKNDFIRGCGDLAIMTYLIDMAGCHTYFIPEAIYQFNTESPLNDFKMFDPNRKKLQKYIKGRRPLKPVSAPF